MTVVDPIRDERGWRFTAAEPDPDQRLGISERGVLLPAIPGYRARVTVPVLWDKRRGRIVSNSDDDIMRMFEREFDAFAVNPKLDLYPRALRLAIDELNDLLYEKFNNGVYRAGFATAQSPYERAATGVFELLDAMEERLANQRYLFGSQPLESDWRFFVTLVRFDPVYYGHFKCNLRRIVGLPEPLRIFARPLPNRRHRRNGGLRPYQTALLHHAKRDQPDTDRTNRPADGSDRAARPGTPLAVALLISSTP